MNAAGRRSTRRLARRMQGQRVKLPARHWSGARFGVVPMLRPFACVDGIIPVYIDEQDRLYRISVRSLRLVRQGETT